MTSNQKPAAFQRDKASLEQREEPSQTFLAGGKFLVCPLLGGACQLWMIKKWAAPHLEQPPEPLKFF